MPLNMNFFPVQTAACGFTFRQLHCSDSIDEKKEIGWLLSNQAASKIGLAEEMTDSGRIVLKNRSWKVCETKTRALLDSRAVPSVLSKELSSKLGVGSKGTNQRIAGVTRQKSLMFGLLQDLPVHIAISFVKLAF